MAGHASSFSYRYEIIGEYVTYLVKEFDLDATRFIRMTFLRQKFYYYHWACGLYGLRSSRFVRSNMAAIFSRRRRHARHADQDTAPPEQRGEKEKHKRERREKTKQEESHHRSS